MTIYVSEYFIYWGSIPNLFFIDYTPTISSLVVEAAVIDYTSYIVTYKTGVFHMFVIFPTPKQYHKWIFKNAIHYKGRHWLKCYRIEFYYLYQKLGFFKKNFSDYDLAGYKYIFMSHVFPFKITDSSEWLRCLEDSRFVEYMGWYSRMRPKRWYLHMGKESLYIFRRILYNEIEDYYHLNMITWTKLFIYTMSLQEKILFAVNAQNFIFYNLTNRNLFSYEWNYNFLPMKWSLELTYLYYLIEIMYILNGLTILLIYAIFFLKWLLIINLFYDFLFLFNFLNKNTIKVVLSIYSFLLGYFEIFRFNMASLRLWKPTLLLEVPSKFHEYFEYKYFSRRNYYYNFKFSLEDVSKREEKIYRAYDDQIKSGFFLMYLLDYRYTLFLKLEKWIIHINYFFHPEFFKNLIEKKSIRGMIFFLNFFLLILILAPFLFVVRVIVFLVRKFKLYNLLIKSYVHGEYSGYAFAEVYDDMEFFGDFEKAQRQHYDIWIYWLSYVYDLAFFQLFIRNSKRKMVRRYVKELSQPLKKERPLDIVEDEYEDEKDWYGLTHVYKSKKRVGIGWKSRFGVEFFLGLFSRNKFHASDFILDDPYFFNIYNGILCIYADLIKHIMKFAKVYEKVVKLFNILLKKFDNKTFINFYFGCLVFYLFFILMNLMMKWHHFNVYKNFGFFFITIKYYLNKYNYIIIFNYSLHFTIIKIIVSIFKILLNILIFFKKKLMFVILKIGEKKLFDYWYLSKNISIYNFTIRYQSRLYFRRIISFFFFRLWLWILSLIFLIFFIEAYDISSNFKLGQFFDVEHYHFLLFDERFTILGTIFAKLQHMYIFYYSKFISHDILFSWDIIILEWLGYLKAWFEIWAGEFVIWPIFSPIKGICDLFGLDHKWYIFHLKLFHDMDYGFIWYNIIIAKLKLPIWYLFLEKYWFFVIYIYVYFFFDWIYYYSVYSMVSFIDTKITILNLNYLLIYVINLFYYIIAYIQYNIYIYSIGDFLKQSTLFEYNFILDIGKFSNNYNFGHIIKLYSKYKTIRASIRLDFFLYMEYLWYYCYHFLFFYSYNILYKIYNFMAYILIIILPTNFQFSYMTYNIISAFDIVNTYVAYPILIFFNKFIMFFMNSEYTFKSTTSVDTINYNAPYAFPFAILKRQQYSGLTSTNQFFFTTLIIKLDILEDILLNGWKYKTKFNSSLFLLSYFYITTIIVVLARLFILTFKKFRWVNIKTRLSQSNLRLWDTLNSKNRHLFTQLEYDWMYSYEWVYSFEKYWSDVFPTDTFTNMCEDSYLVNREEAPIRIYQFLTKFYAKKKISDLPLGGWRIIKFTDKYYWKRYTKVMNVIQNIYHLSINMKKQTSLFHKIGFFFDNSHFFEERSKYIRDYYGNLNHRRYNDYIQFWGQTGYNEWLLKISMPLLYEFCDHPNFIKHYMSNDISQRRNIWKMETFLDEKLDHKIDFVELYFTDPELHEEFTDTFLPDDVTLFGKFFEHRMNHLFVFKPWFGNTHVLNKPWINDSLFNMEDYFLKLSKWDEKYFNNIFNFTFFHVFEWPQLLKTKIQIEQLYALHDAHDPDQNFEETEFMPTNTNIMRGDTERDHEFQLRVNDYWRKVLVPIDDIHSELGLFIYKFYPSFPLIWVYLPAIITGGHFWEAFSSHANLLDPVPVLFSYILILFQYINIDFSTYSMHDDLFIVNPIMGAITTRNYGISTVLSYLGQGYQTWILFNIDVPLKYHELLFIYSYPNIDFYPFQEYFSPWEKSLYFYNEEIIEKHYYRNRVRFWTKLNMDVPIGFDAWHWDYEFSHGFGIKDFLTHWLKRILVLVIGLIGPQLPPFLLICFFNLVIYITIVKWIVYFYTNNILKHSIFAIKENIAASVKH